MNEILGIDQDTHRESNFNYSANFDVRDIMEDFMRNSVSPQTSVQTSRSLTRDETIAAIKDLNQSQVKAIRNAQARYSDTQ